MTPIVFTTCSRCGYKMRTVMERPDSLWSDICTHTIHDAELDGDQWVSLLHLPWDLESAVRAMYRCFPDQKELISQHYPEVTLSRLPNRE